MRVLNFFLVRKGTYYTILCILVWDGLHQYTKLVVLSIRSGPLSTFYTKTRVLKIFLVKQKGTSYTYLCILVFLVWDGLFTPCDL